MKQTLLLLCLVSITIGVYGAAEQVGSLLLRTFEATHADNDFGCTLSLETRFRYGNGPATELLNTTTETSVYSCLATCQLSTPGCVAVTFWSAQSECRSYSNYYRGISEADTNYASAFCPATLVSNANVTVVDASTASTAAARDSLAYTLLHDSSPHHAWDSRLNTAGPPPIPSYFPEDDTEATTAAHYVVFALPVAPAGPAHAINAYDATDTDPPRQFSEVRFRMAENSDYIIEALQVMVGRVALTPAPLLANAVWNATVIKTDALTEDAVASIKLEEPFPFSTATHVTYFAFRALAVRNTTNSRVNLTNANLAHVGVTIADFTFYASSTTLDVYVSSSSSSVPVSSSSLSSSSMPVSSSSTADSSSSSPAPTGPKCLFEAPCYTILRQNCTSTSKCGACIPGKYGTPPPSNENDCCDYDCPSLHRLPCSSSGAQCGECMEGWVPPEGSQAQDLPFRAQPCIPQPDVNGGWSVWGPCDRACGGGRRFRTCSDPLPVGQGTDCVGLAVSNCNMAACPSVDASDPCLRSPSVCMNGATCVSWPDVTTSCGYGHTCQCPVGFMGRTCEIDAVGKAVGNILKSIQDASAFQRYYFPDSRTAASLQWVKPRPGEEWGDNIDRRVSRLEDEGFAGYGSPEELRHWALFHQPNRFGPYPIPPSSSGGLPALQDVINRLLFPTSVPYSSSSAAAPSSSSSSGPNITSSSTGSSSTDSSTGSSSSAVVFILLEQDEKLSPPAPVSLAPPVSSPPSLRAAANPSPPASAPSSPAATDFQQVQRPLQPVAEAAEAAPPRQHYHPHHRHHRREEPPVAPRPVMSREQEIRVRSAEAIQEAIEEAAAMPSQGVVEADASLFVEKDSRMHHGRHHRLSVVADDRNSASTSSHSLFVYVLLCALAWLCRT